MELLSAAPARQPPAPAFPTLNIDSALSRLGDFVVACCVSYPSDEVLDQRLRAHCAALESGMAPAERSRWGAERDSLLMRLGCRPWSY